VSRGRLIFGRPGADALANACLSRYVYRVKPAIACAVVILLAPFDGGAEGQPPSPSAEVMAAYCGGVLKREIEMLRNLPTTGDASAQAIRRQYGGAMLAQDQALLRRYTLYLLAMGDAGADGSEGDTLVTEALAMQRGRAEVDQCMDATKALEATCRRNGNCGASPPICLRQQQCQNPQDLLPFPYGQ